METLVEEWSEAPLIAAWLAGNPCGWQDLVDQYQDGLKACIRSWLRRRGIKDENVVEEVLSNVWVVLSIRKKLARYRFRNGKLRWYLAGVAWKEVLLWLRDRAKDKRHRQKLAYAQPEPLTHDESGLKVALDEFMEELTASERAYLVQVLLKDTSSGEARSFSRGNARLFRCRIKRKYHCFMELGGGDSLWLKLTGYNYYRFVRMPLRYHAASVAGMAKRSSTDMGQCPRGAETNGCTF
jgi:DNA-directed RNA polymerase specialized sigma24 family protein